MARTWLQKLYLRSFLRLFSPSVCVVYHHSTDLRASAALLMPVVEITAYTCWFRCARFSDACHSLTNSCDRPDGTSVTFCRPSRSSFDPVTSRMNRS